MNTNDYKQIKELATFCKNLDINPRDAYENIITDTADFEVDNYRFICADDIDKIQQDELSSDEYMLGCFQAWFLADILDAPVQAIEAMQKAEAFEAIGTWIIEADKIEELQESFASTDGYGHHFNHYDFGEEEILNYYVFRTN